MRPMPADGPVGLMVQALLETGTRVSEFIALWVEDVSLGERMIVIENGKGGKRREVPIRTDLSPAPAHARQGPEPAPKAEAGSGGCSPSAPTPRNGLARSSRYTRPAPSGAS